MKNLYERQFFSALTGDGQQQSNSGTPPATNEADTGLDIKLPEKWFDKLPDEFKREESLKNITDFNSLIKSYVHAQKMVGAEKIPVPGKFSTEDDWKTVYSKLGLPKDLAQYQVEVPKDVEFEEEFVNSFKEIAHKNGILPKQANGLMNWMGEAMKATQAKSQEQMENTKKEWIQSIQKEWGNAFNDNLQVARLAINKLGDDSLKQFIEENNLGDNPQMIKLFHKVGSLLKEQKQLDLGTTSSFSNALTPVEAQKKVEAILTDMSHPYYNAEHPKHKLAVEEVQELYKSAYPT